jgi:hypothetical protein
MTNEGYAVGLVGCASQKLKRPASARELYVSQLFTKASAYAELTTDRWYVLSGPGSLLVGRPQLRVRGTGEAQGVADRRGGGSGQLGAATSWPTAVHQHPLLVRSCILPAARLWDCPVEAHG